MAAEITSEFVWQNIPRRPRDSHKGTFGSVLAVAGSAFYRGAALLAAEGALRTGAGIVTLASVEPVVSAAAARLPECCLCPCRAGAEGGISPENVPLLRRQKATVLLLGPGLGGTAQSAAREAETQALVQQLLPGFAGSAVLDADGLNAAARLLAEGGAFPHPAGELIVTPHPGEMARLTGLSAAQINADREGTALRCAQAWNAVVVLKGARTVVAAPDGRVRVNPTGNPGLSRGGSGDVLAGMTAALLACRLCGVPAWCRRRPCRRRPRRIRHAAPRYPAGTGQDVCGTSAIKKPPHCGGEAFVHLILLQLQQILLYLQPVGVAGEGAVGTHYPVAGLDDGNGVAVAGPTHGAGGLWFAEGRGQLTVGAHLAVGNLVHLGPDRFLEGGAFGGQRQVELPPCPGKVFVELLFGFLQQGRLADFAGQRLQVRHAVRTQLYPAQGVVLFLQPQGAQHAVDVPDVQKTNASFLDRMCYTDGILTQNQP